MYFFLCMHEVFMNVFVRRYVHILYIYTYLRIFVCIHTTHAHIRTHLHTYAHIRTHALERTHQRTRACTHTRTRI